MGVEFIDNPNQPEYVDEEEIQMDDMSVMYFNMEEESADEEDYAVTIETVMRGPFRIDEDTEEDEEEEFEDDDDDDSYNPMDDYLSSDLSDDSEEVQQYMMDAGYCLSGSQGTEDLIASNAVEEQLATAQTATPPDTSSGNPWKCPSPAQNEAADCDAGW